MPCEVTFYEGRAISVEMANSVVREVEYTEPAVKGDTSGKVLKPARIKPDRLRDCPGSGVREHRRQDRDRHAHCRVPQPREVILGLVWTQGSPKSCFLPGTGHPFVLLLR
jgi:hypothetical protein